MKRKQEVVYACFKCHYFTTNKKYYDVHVTSKKHRGVPEAKRGPTTNDADGPKWHTCEKCGSKFKHMQSILYHRRNVQCLVSEYLDSKRHRTRAVEQAQQAHSDSMFWRIINELERVPYSTRYFDLLMKTEKRTIDDTLAEAIRVATPQERESIKTNSDTRFVHPKQTVISERLACLISELN